MEHYVFVASAGAYKGNAIEPALVEGDPRKDKGHPEVEKYLEAQVGIQPSSLVCLTHITPCHLPKAPACRPHAAY